MTAQRKRRGRQPETILRELRATIRTMAALAGWTTASQIAELEAIGLSQLSELRAALKGAKT